MKIKTKIIIFLILLPIGLAVGLFFSWCANSILTKNIPNFQDFKISVILENLKSDEKFRKLTLIIEAVAVVGIAAILLMNKRETFESDTIRLTEKINVPVPVGQGQHGAACWLKKNDYPRIFTLYKLNAKKNEIFADLLEKGENSGQTIKKPSEVQKVNNIDKSEENTENEVVEKAEKKIDLKEIFNENPAETKESEETPAIAQQKIIPLKIKKKKDAEINEKFPGGLVVNYEKYGKTEHIYYLSKDVHSLTIGATRSGKTRCLVIESISFTALSGESMVITDPKGELTAYCSAYLANLGYEVICLDFKEPLKSSRYNFLQPIIDAVNADDTSKAVKLVWDITSSLVEKSKNGERIWTNGEMSVTAGAIMSVVFDNKKNPEFQNLTNVYNFILYMCQNVKIEKNGKNHEFMPINDYLKQLPEHHPAKEIFGVAQIAPERTRGSFFTSALTTLQLFTDKNIYSMTNTSDFVLAETGSKKRAVFIVLPDETDTYYALASLFVYQHYVALTQTADKRGGRLQNRVNFWLDEFGNFTVIPAFSNMLTVAGGRGIRFNLFVQDLAQIEKKYGREDARTIEGNCHCWVYLATEDFETAQKISKKLGNYTTSSYSRSSSYSKNSNPNSSNSMNLIARPLLTEDEIGLIERPYVIIMYSRNRPALMKLPDLHKWLFNTALGLGNEEHNTKVRETRNNLRFSRNSEEKKLWGIWYNFGIQKPPDISDTPDKTKQINENSQADDFPEQESTANTDTPNENNPVMAIANNDIFSSQKKNNANKNPTLTYDERKKFYDQN